MQELESPPLLFAGSSHPALGQEVASHLGIQLGRMRSTRFVDGEISIRIEESVRGRDVFVLQTIALDPDRYLMELLILLDALKRASARSIAVILPYFGYCRQDRRAQPLEPITAKLVANLLVTAGATRVVAMDLHSEQLEGFFDIPVDHLSGRSLLVEAIKRQLHGPYVVVAPDLGNIKLARSYAEELKVDFAIIDKKRKSDQVVEVLAIIGDVNGKDVLLADDMCSTAGTLVSAAKACREKGAKGIFAVVTHGVFVGEAAARIEESPLEALWVSNTIPRTERLLPTHKVAYVSIAPLFGQAIRCISSAM